MMQGPKWGSSGRSWSVDAARVPDGDALGPVVVEDNSALLLIALDLGPNVLADLVRVDGREPQRELPDRHDEHVVGFAVRPSRGHKSTTEFVLVGEAPALAAVMYGGRAAGVATSRTQGRT